jgi:Rrf2 family cysteine metabolism transcriptional repressor
LLDDGECMPLPDIAMNLGISGTNSEVIFTALSHYGLVSAKKGSEGGYFLAKSANAISIADIVCAIDKTEKSIDVRGYSSKQWENFYKEVMGFLNSINLEYLVSEPCALPEVTNSEAKFHGWGISKVQGGVRIQKRINNKLIQFYIGKKWDEAKALEKLRANGYL